MKKSGKKILIIYTGGTIGMVHEHKSRTLVPFDFSSITKAIPELNHLECEIGFHSSHHPIDSSNITPSVWEDLGRLIEKNIRRYDGFVILHGTDTMAYTASTLSYMLVNLPVPVILTGSQLPLGIIRTDAKRNLITAVEIAGGNTIVPEVCIYFNNRLLRGNRAEKYSSSRFDAFQSLNYPPLAEAGVKIVYNTKAIRNKPRGKFRLQPGFNTDVGLVKIFPGMSMDFLKSAVSTKGLKGMILETFGSGNAPTHSGFLEIIREAVAKGIIVVNVSQCSGGAVEQGKYETSLRLQEIGVISGGDMTSEAAVVKLMWLLANKADTRKRITEDIAGEISA